MDKGDDNGINTIIITFLRDPMLQIARHTDYAARIVLHLACLGEGAQAAIAEIAEQRRLPEFFVRRLVGKLVQGGILASNRGASGGIRLARPAAQITLLDLVRVMEGPIALNRCLEPGPHLPVRRHLPGAVRMGRGHPGPGGRPGRRPLRRPGRRPVRPSGPPTANFQLTEILPAPEGRTHTTSSAGRSLWTS